MPARAPIAPRLPSGLDTPALVIDLGMAFVTRRQMQTAADAAALTGLRFRDELPPFELEDVADCDCEDSSEIDTARRKLASLTVSYLFDDDFDLTDDPRSLGVGPIIGEACRIRSRFDAGTKSELAFLGSFAISLAAMPTSARASGLTTTRL